MSTKYIFIDIDGTLLSHTTGIPDSAKEAIGLARANGHKVFINTGRVKSAVDAIIRSMPFDGMVYAAGAHVEINEKTLVEHQLDSKDLERLIELFEDQEVGYVLEGSSISYYNEKAIAFFNKRMENKQLLKPQVSRHLVQENMVAPLANYFARPTTINKCSIFADNNDQIYRLEEALDDKFQFIIYDENHSGEIILRGIDKSYGIRKVLEQFGADMSDAMALGDSMNDYEMVKAAGAGVAMGNAHDRLKAVADYVTFDVDDAGLFHALKYYKVI